MPITTNRVVGEVSVPRRKAPHWWSSHSKSWWSSKTWWSSDSHDNGC